MAVTEIGCCGVKPDMNIIDETTPEGRIFMGVYKTIIASAGAPHRIYLGTELDKPSVVYGFFDWDSLEHHEIFAKAFVEEFTPDLAKVLTHGEYVKHITATTSLPEALKAPITDVFLVYYPSEISTVEKDVASADLQEVINGTFAQRPDVAAISYGWGIENDFPVKGLDEERVGSVLSAFVGWSQAEANTKFCGTDAHNSVQRSIRGLNGVLELKAFHLSCTFLERKSEQMEAKDHE